MTQVFTALWLLDFCNSQVWLQDVAEIRIIEKKTYKKKTASWNMRTRPAGLKEESITLSFSDVEFMFL